MSKITSKSIALCIITQLCLISCVLSQQHETEFLHHGFLKANILKFGSSNILPSGALELTNTSRQQMGQAFHAFPIPFNNSLSFSTSFVFSIDEPGHALTFMISPSMDFTRAMSSQYLGLFNTSNNGNSTNRILAVEFDTVKSKEFLDINGNHVGIDLNGLESVESAPAAYFSNGKRKNVSLQLWEGEPIRAWIEYSEKDMLLNVTLAPYEFLKPKFPLLSRKMNLSEIFMEEMYVGFSASTGSITSGHYVRGWSFSKKGKAKDFDLTLLPDLSTSPTMIYNVGCTPDSAATVMAKCTKLIIICILAVMVFVI